jgi:hypothetical protein
MPPQRQVICTLRERVRQDACSTVEALSFMLQAWRTAVVACCHGAALCAGDGCA